MLVFTSLKCQVVLGPLCHHLWVLQLPEAGPPPHSSPPLGQQSGDFGCSAGVSLPCRSPFRSGLGCGAEAHPCLPDSALGAPGSLCACDPVFWVEPAPLRAVLATVGSGGAGVPAAAEVAAVPLSSDPAHPAAALGSGVELAQGTMEKG